MDDPFSHIKDHKAPPPRALWLAGSTLILAIVLTLFKISVLITAPFFLTALGAAVVAFVQGRNLKSTAVLLIVLLTTAVFGYVLPITRVSRLAQDSQQQAFNTFQQGLAEDLSTYARDLGDITTARQALRDQLLLSDIRAFYLDSSDSEKIASLHFSLLNSSKQILQSVKLNAIFLNRRNEVIHLETFYVFNAYSEAFVTELAPGERLEVGNNHRITFSRLPASWHEGNIKLEVDAVTVK